MWTDTRKFDLKFFCSIKVDFFIILISFSVIFCDVFLPFFNEWKVTEIYKRGILEQLTMGAANGNYDAWSGCNKSDNPLLFAYAFLNFHYWMVELKLWFFLNLWIKCFYFVAVISIKMYAPASWFGNYGAPLIFKKIRDSSWV